MSGTAAARERWGLAHPVLVRTVGDQRSQHARTGVRSRPRPPQRIGASPGRRGGTR